MATRGHERTEIQRMHGANTVVLLRKHGARIKLRTADQLDLIAYNPGRNNRIAARDAAIESIYPGAANKLIVLGDLAGHYESDAQELCAFFNDIWQAAGRKIKQLQKMEHEYSRKMPDTFADAASRYDMYEALTGEIIEAICRSLAMIDGAAIVGKTRVFREEQPLPMPAE